MARHPILFATLFYGALSAVLTGPALLGRATLGPERVLDWDPLYRTEPAPPLPDFSDYTPALLDLPRELVFAAGLRQGRLDAWNPLSAAGAPLWAAYGGPFLPLKLVLYVAPSLAGYQAFAALRLVVAGLGAFLLARSRGLRGPAALAAGATYEISGALIAFLPFASASAPFLLPWVVLGGFAIAERATLAPAVGTGIALGIVASSGHPTMILLVFAAFAVSMVGHALGTRRRPRRTARMFVHTLLAVALGLALAAPSLLPLAEMTRQGATYKDERIGDRMRDQSLQAARGSVLMSLLASAPLGTAPNTKFATNLAPSIGTLALYAAIAGMLARRLHPALGALAIFGATLALAPPGSAFLQRLPGLRLILPTYAWAPLALALTQMAGDGVSVLTRERRRLGAIALAVFIAVAVVLAVAPTRRAPPSAASTAPLVAVAGAAAVLAGCAAARGTRIGALAEPLLATLIVLEPLLTIQRMVLQPPPSVLAGPPSPAVRFLQERLADRNARLVGIPFRVGYPMSPMLFGLPDFRGSSPLVVRRYARYMQAIGGGTVDLTQEVRTTRSPLLDLAAVRYVVLSAPLDPTKVRLDTALLLAVRDRPAADDPALPLIYADERIVVHENRNALSRVRLAHRSAHVADEAAAVGWATSLRKRRESAAELGLADTVTLEPDERGNAAPEVSGSGAPGEYVRLLGPHDPDRVRIAARLDAPGYVVVADTYYPGWKAWIDGAPASIFPADLLFRAVYAPGGEHQIEMRYEPRSLRYGLVLFAAAAAFSAWAAAPSLRRRTLRREQPK